MEISINTVIGIMDTIVDYPKYKDILEENEKAIKSAKNEQEVSNVVINSKNSIINWYNIILLKSGLIFTILLILSYIVYTNCFIIISDIIYNLIVTLVVMLAIYVFIYILIKIFKRKRVIKELFKQIDDSAYKYGIHVEHVYAY